MANASGVQFRVDAQRVRRGGSTWAQLLELIAFRQPTAAPTDTTSPYAVVIADAAGQVLMAYPAPDPERAGAIIEGLQAELAAADTLSAFLDGHGVPTSRRQNLGT